MPPSDIVCFSHLPWDFVFQRPNHLMTRAARTRRVFFVEEPFDSATGAMTSVPVATNLQVVRLGLPFALDRESRFTLLRGLLDELLARQAVRRPWRWYLTPMALPWSDHLPAAAVVYDCMDELAAFRGAAVERLVELEDTLFRLADVVFTGGHRLWHAKRDRHESIHPFPSAVDVEHFSQARAGAAEPADQARIPRPRIGFFGVIDERIDLELLDDVAARRPDWSFVLVGPVAKIAPDELPARPNVHHLGARAYADLPSYLGGWDVAILPFAHNAATAFISPTKTPEYLAGGRPVVSTSIHDVVHPWADLGVVRIADGAGPFVAAIEAALSEDETARRARDAVVADALAGRSWDATWAAMERLVEEAVGVAARPPHPTPPAAHGLAEPANEVAA